MNSFSNTAAKLVYRRVVDASMPLMDILSYNKKETKSILKQEVSIGGIKKIDTAICLKEKEIEKLKEYKISLIYGVVTGKVKVC